MDKFPEIEHPSKCSSSSKARPYIRVHADGITEINFPDLRGLRTCNCVKISGWILFPIKILSYANIQGRVRSGSETSTPRSDALCSIWQSYKLLFPEANRNIAVNN
jgi:hypothetical protein